MGRKFIIKADDFLKDGLSRSWKYFLDTCYDTQVRVMLGVVGKGAERYSSTVADKFVEYNGMFVHGYYHWVNRNKTCEYRGTDRSFQEDSIRKTIDVVRDAFDKTSTSFGAPGNATDSNTVLALRQIKEVKHVFFTPDIEGKVTIKRNYEFEYRYEGKLAYYCGLVSGKFLHMSINNAPPKDLQRRLAMSVTDGDGILCGQIHPNWWSVGQIRQLSAFLLELKNNGFEFSLV